MTPGIFKLLDGETVVAADAQSYIHGETHIIARIAGEVEYMGVSGEERTVTVIIAHPSHKPMRLTVEYVEE